MKALLRTRAARLAAGLTVGLALVVVALAWRIAMAPLGVDWCRPHLEHALASRVDGGRAHIDHVGLAWFAEERSLGLRLTGVRLTDGRGRQVLTARQVDAGIALDALPGLVIVPGRVAAEHFFAAVSVSPQGRYALGYDVQGASPVGGKSELDRLLLDLTGKSRLGRPSSYLRTLDLRDGRLALRQVGGATAWTADIRRLRFSKIAGRLLAEADARLEGGGDHPTSLRATATAAVGLSHALVKAQIENLIPAHVFPSVGPTASLAELEAVVQGRADLAYDFASGVQAANMAVEAGQGRLSFGGASQAFKSAHIVAAYEPASGEVVLSAFKVEAERTRLDLNGRFHLIPEDRRTRRAAELDYAIGGPRFVWRLASDAPPQDLFDVVVRGKLLPQQRRLEFTQARATVAGTVLNAHGALFRDKQGQLGAQIQARASGTVGRDQIFAFWPIDFAGSVRSYLHRAVLGGRFVNAAFVLDAHPGHMHSEGLDNDELRLDFGLDDASFRFADEFPPIEHGHGSGRLQGDRFDLKVADARVGNIALSQGSVEMPDFRNHGADATYAFRMQGPVRELLQALDGPKLHLISKSGFAPSRTSGLADVRVEVRRPMLFEVPMKDIKIRYGGQIRQGGVTQAALGWDMTDAALTLDGDQSHFTLKGVGSAGPYSGGVDLLCEFRDEANKGELLNLAGALDAGIVGGPDGRRSPFGGRFKIRGGEGVGIVHSGLFDGRVAWKDGDGPRRFVLEGWGDGAGLRRAGAPFTVGLPDRFPTQLTLARTGEVWRGPLKADALSGGVSFTSGPRQRLVYDSDLTPQKARRLGLGGLHLFDVPRHLLVDAIFAGGDGGTANVKAGSVDLNLAWTHTPSGQTEHRLRANLTAADAASLGLPGVIGAGSPVPVAAVWRGAGDGMAGQVQVPDALVKFQSAPARGGGSILTLTADLDRNVLRRLGLPPVIRFEGVVGLTARVASSDRGPAAGRIDLDLARTDFALDQTDFHKAAGRPGRAVIDFVQDSSGGAKLTRISAQSEALDVEGSAVLGSGRLISADLNRLRLNGVIDAAVRLARDPMGGGLAVNVRGRQFDARRWLARSKEPAASNAALSAASAGGGAKGGEAAPLRLDVALDSVRLTDDTTLRDVRAAGFWGGTSVMRMEMTAFTANAGKLHGKLFPQGGYTAIQADTTDAGEVARGLFQVKDLKGGQATITGRLVDGGADLKVLIRDVRVVHAPAMAQVLTLGSFKGLADTLNGEGVLFTHVEAPLQIRGSRLILGEARATGSALGLTAEGSADMVAGRMDIRGTLAPAYSLNSAIGAVPVLGQILTSRKGEGVFGLGYSAKGPIDKPQVMVNPLSLVTPGILRRVFEGPTASGAPAASPASPARNGGD